MPVYDPATAPFDKPAATAHDPSQVRFDDGSYAVEPSVLSETLKAPARVIGGFAQEAGEMAQYATGDRAGMGIRKWGEGVQERNAQTPAFREAHPVLSTAGDVAEGVAKMAPYLAADVALSAVAPEAGLPAAAGLVARGIRAAKAAPFATTVLPAVAGLAQGQRSYEKGVANGLTPDQALSASYAPAAVTGAGMAAMGAMSEGLQGVGGAAKSLKGQFVKHAAADTAIMMGQGVATTAAEKATGIDPNAKPLDQLKDPKAWLNAALTGGMFAGLGVAKKGLVAKALKDHLDTLHEATPEERVASVEALSQAVHPEDPSAQAAFQADTLDKIQAGEPVISEEIINKLTKETPETTRESVLDGLKASVESGGEIDPIEAHNAVEESKVVEALKSEAPQESPQTIYRGEIPFKEGDLTGESKGVRTGDYWTLDKSLAEYYRDAGGKRDDGYVRAAEIDPSAKVLTLTDAEGNLDAEGARVWKSVTGTDLDPVRLMEHGLEGHAEAFRKAGYDVIHSTDMDGPETLVLNHAKLKETPRGAEAPQEPVAFTRAKRWLKDGFTEAREGSEPDAEVAAHLDDMGYTLVKGERADRTSGGNVARREWRVEKKPATSIVAPDFMGIGTGSEDYQPMVDTARDAVEQGNYDAVKTTKGADLRLVHMDDGGRQGSARILAFDAEGKLVGDLEYATDTMENGDGFNPFVHVDESARRKGVATAMYDAAEARGGKIPAFDQYGQVRTPEGQAFRAARAGVEATPEPSAKALADGEVRKLSDREAIARQGDTLILGSKNAEGGWDHVAKADLHKDGHFEVSASESETPEAAARMVSVLRELRMNRAEGTGLPKADIDAHLSNIISKLKVPVEVVNHAGEISGLREDAPKFNGAFHNGKIYLNAEHLTSLKEAEHVLLKHELAHAGLRGALGEKGLNDVLAKAWGDVNSGVREFAKEKGIETRTKAGKLEATEEYLVSLAEQGTKHPLWDKFVATLKAAMRKLGFDMKYSDAELRSLVVEAARSMRSGEGPTRFSRLYRGDSTHEDGLGEGTMGDLGRGFYFSDAPHVAEYFTDGTDPSHVRPFDVDLKKPFDLGSRDFAADPSWKAMVGTLPEDPEIGVKNKQNLDEWAKGKLDVRNTYGFLARSFGQTPATFNDFLAAHGYDGVVDQGVRGVTDGTQQYVAFSKGDISARFSRLSLKPKTKDVDDVSQETTTQVVKRVLSDISGNTWRAIMPIDKTIKMAQSIPTYAPIRENLTRLQELRRFKEAAGTAPSIEAEHIRADYKKVVKTEKDLKTYNDLTHKATLYELHADPSKPLPWTEKTWKEAGKQKQTGLSLGQAVKEVRDLWNGLTPAQREVQQRAIAHMKELKKEHIEAQLDVLKLTFPEDTFDAAEKVAETLHKEMWKAEQIGGAEAAGMKRAELATAHGADVMHLAEQIAAIKHEGQLKGDYAPLMRFGDHIVSTFVKTAGGEGKRLEVRHFETKGEAMAEVRRIQADPTKMATYDLQPEAQRSVVNIPLEFLNKMQAAMDAKGIDPAQQEALMQDFKSARLSTMPRNSLEGNRLNREGIAGYEDSAVRSYAAYVQRASRTIANLKYGTKIDQTFRDMDNNIKAYQDPEQKWDPQAVERMASLKDNLYTLEKQHNTEKINEITKAIGKTTFLWYLSSPSVWAVQWSQPFVTTIPKMASRYGFGKAFGAYVSEAKNFTAGHFSDEKIDAFDRENGAVGRRVFDLIEQYREAVTKEEKAKLSREMKSVYDGFSEKDQKLLILKVMSHQGAIDLSAAHSLHDLVNSTDVFNKGIDYLVDKGGVFMRASETGSRRAAAVSAFRMALEDGKDFMKANDYASHIIDDTLFDFSSQNRAAIMKGNVGRVVGQFQFFRLHMLGKTIQLAKDAYKGEFKGEARKELAYMMGTSMALAGAGGTPLAMLAGSTVSQAIWDAASFLFGDPDDPWDPKADFESAMKDAVGEDATNTFMKGLPYLMGVDVSKRIGLGGMANVIQGEVPPGASPTDRANWYAAKLLGPSWGLVTDGMKTFDALGNGDYGTAMQAGSPKVLRDFMKAYDVSQDGVRGPGGRTVLQSDDVSPFSVALQMVGINPADISLASEEAREFKNATTELKQRRSLLMKRVTDATMAGDMDARESALADVNAWGEKQPALKISVRELANSVKRGMDLKVGKMSKQDERLKEEGL